MNTFAENANKAPLTREQYIRLEAVLEEYEGQHFDLSITYEDECPELTTRASFSVADYDNAHDFDWLRSRLREAGIDPAGLRMYEECGDALIGRKGCRLCVLEIAMENT